LSKNREPKRIIWRFCFAGVRVKSVACALHTSATAHGAIVAAAEEKVCEHRHVGKVEANTAMVSGMASNANDRQAGHREDESEVN
jgi:hypothetical protein